MSKALVVGLFVVSVALSFLAGAAWIAASIPRQSSPSALCQDALARRQNAEAALASAANLSQRVSARRVITTVEADITRYC